MLRSGGGGGSGGGRKAARRYSRTRQGEVAVSVAGTAATCSGAAAVAEAAVGPLLDLP